MARIKAAAEVIDDLDRFQAHMVKHAAVDAGDRVDEILQAVGVIETSPMIVSKHPSHPDEAIPPWPAG